MNFFQKLVNFLILLIKNIFNVRVIRLKKLYSIWEQQHLKKIFKYTEVDCVFDIGANYGQYAKMLRSDIKFKGLIISFEPIPGCS